tara:strand:+ start:286 stop:447 length:162 start_codon:yes stop_codon:yes gene_type:complete
MKSTKHTDKQLEESTQKQFGIALAVCLSMISTVAAVAGMAAYANWSTITRLLA